jgi:hypothetical protein
MNIINDTSSQTVITTLPTITGIFNPFITSNELYTGFYTRTQVDNIPALSNFYNKTTIDNNYYTKTSTDNLLNAKENILTFSSPLSRSVNTISINLNNYATWVGLNSCNYITNAALIPYATFAAINSSNFANNNLVVKYNDLITSNFANNNLVVKYSNLITSNFANNNLVVKYTDLTTSNFITNTALTPYATYTALNTCNYITNTALTPYATYTALNTCNYITNTALTPYATYTALNSSNFLTSTSANSTYLRLSGGQMTGTIGFGVAPSASILINCYNASSTAFQNIQMMNNVGEFFYFGMAGNAVGNGSYLNNFFIQSSKGLVFNSTNKTHTGTPDMIINNASVGINTTAPNTTYKLDVNGALRVNSNINITGSASNQLIFDNVLNGRKIVISSNHSIGVDGDGMIFAASGFRFAKANNINDIVFTISAVGDLTFAGTIFSGAISTGGGILASSLTLGSTGDIITVRNITASGTVSANSFTEGGVALSSKYLQTASLGNYATWVGVNSSNFLTTTTANSTYLRLNGASDMTGKLTNNSGLTGAPTIGDYGGNGDRLILWKGGGNYPYSLGINGGTMWYSVPGTSIHNFYVNGTSKFQVNPSGVGLTGFLVITGTNPAFFFGGGGGAALGQASSASQFSTSALTGDCILRAQPSTRLILQTGDGGAHFFINSAGNVFVVNSLFVANMQIYDYLFNSTGTTHSSISDFNTVSSFGYRFFTNTTNGPGTQGTLNQFYSWYIGLGSEYPASQFGCQFALPRDITNPVLSVRFKENNVWRAWTEITARVLNGTATFTVNVWHKSSDNQQRLYFENNTTTYIQGQGTNPIIFRNNANEDIMTLNSIGKITCKTINVSGFDGITLRIDGANNYWNIYTGTTPTTLKTNSLIFFHGASGIASNWWLDGTQTNTNADISDKRSKYNVREFLALETIKKLKPKSYDVIDDKDVKFQYGFIAQDIEEIDELKKLVFSEPNYVANVNSYGTRRNDGGGCIITAHDDLTGKIEVGDELKLVSDNNEDKEFVLDATPYHNRYKRRYAKITEIISPTEFKVDCEVNKLCCNDDDPFLIYGKKVDDAKSLDYNSFIALNTKAIQELYDIINKQQQQIDLLREDYVRLLSKIQLE